MNDPLGGIRPGCWLRDAKNPSVYAYYKGIAPDGTLRLLPLERPPYGKTVHVLDNGTVSTERVPFRMEPPVVTGAVLCGIALLAALTFASADGDTAFGVLVSLVAAAICAFSACLAHNAHIHPIDHWDEQEMQRQAYYEAQAEYWNSLQQDAWAAQRATQQQAAQARQMQQAQWGQLASINAALNPGTDVWRPYGQSPPMSPPM